MAKHLPIGATDVCRHCKNSIVWWISSEKMTYSGEEDRLRYSQPMWWHPVPDDRQPNTEFSITFDSKHKIMERLCSQNEAGAKEHAEPMTYCQSDSENNPGGVCNRPIRDKEKMMCGIHATHADKKDKEYEERIANQHFNMAVREGVQELIGKMKEEFGLDAREMRTYGDPSPEIVVNAEQFLEVLRGQPLS